jgi:hypothetical protein
VTQRFHADSLRNARAELRREVEREVRARYAEPLAQAVGLRYAILRCRRRLEIERETRRRSRERYSDRTLG